MFCYTLITNKAIKTTKCISGISPIEIRYKRFRKYIEKGNLKEGTKVMIYTVTFNPALDYVVFLDNLKLGDVNRSTRESIFYGGKGINVSTILNTLGLETTALGFVAGFTGKAIEDGLAAQGIHTDFIHLPEGNSRINVKVKHGDETEINGQGPVITEEAINELFAKLDTLTKEDILVLAGSIPNTLPEDIYEKILARLESKGIRVVVDATKDLLLNVLKSSATFPFNSITSIFSVISF